MIGRFVRKGRETNYNGFNELMHSSVKGYVHIRAKDIIGP